MKLTKIALIMLAAGSLAACEGGEGLTPIGADKTIDRGINAHHLSQLKAGIWIDPEGCDHWIIDDGVEGYSGRRFDPVSGLPVCNNKYPPGTVLRNYQTMDAGIRDYVPQPARN